MIFFFQKNITLKIRNKPSRKLKAMNHSAYTIPVRLSLFLFFAIILYSCSDNDQLFDGGNGSEANPFQISTIEQLQEIGKEENLNKHFIQVGDIDASVTVDPANARRFTRIGNQESPFTGSLNGNGYSIYDMVLNTGTDKLHNGLFGYVKEGVIRNIRVVNQVELSEETDPFTIRKAQTESMEFLIATEDDLLERSAFGFLVGYNDGGQIMNCFVQAKVAGKSRSLGGLVGINTGTIEDSKFTGTVSGLKSGAGLVGVNAGKVLDSSTTGRVSSQTVAGLVSYNIGGEISNSYSTTDVSSGFTVGGLVAYNSGLISASYSKENSIFDSIGIIGGLVAQNEGEIIYSYARTELFNLFESNRDIITGGLVGENIENGKITNSYAAGKIDTPEQGITAGLVGTNEGLLVNAYWDTDITGQSDGVGEGNSAVSATGLTTNEMTGPAAEQNLPEFDWQTVWRTTDSYPELWWQDDE